MLSTIAVNITVSVEEDGPRASSTGCDSTVWQSQIVMMRYWRYG